MGKHKVNQPREECAYKSSLRKQLGSKSAGVIFDSGQSALQWRDEVSNIVSHFLQVPGGWDLVKPLKTIEDEVEVDDPRETEYLEVEPTVEVTVDAVIEKKKKSARKLHAQNLKHNLAGVNLNLYSQIVADQKAHDLRGLFENKIAAIEDLRDSLMDNYVKAHTQWKKGKKEFEDVRSQVLGVFNRIFGPSLLKQIQVELGEMRFRAAMAVLEKRYSLSTGGLDNIKSVLNMLMTKTFNPGSGESLTTHIQQLMDWNNQLGESGLKEGVLLIFIMDSISKSSCTSFKDDIDAVRRQNMSLVDSIALFQATSSRLMVEIEASAFSNPQIEQANMTAKVKGHKSKAGKKKTNFEKRVANGVATALAAQAAPARVSNYPTKADKALLRCTVCQGLGLSGVGHTKDTCFSVVPCSKCKGFGHGWWMCNGVNNNSSSSVPGPVNISGRVPLKNSNNKSEMYCTETSGFDFSSNCYFEKSETASALIGAVDSSTNLAGQSFDYFERHELETVSDLLAQTIVALVSFDGETELCHCRMRVIIDSGASSHMVPLRSVVQNLRPINGAVKLGDNNVKLAIEGVGSTSVPGLTDVLLVPKLSVALLSVPKFDADGCKTVFAAGKAKVTGKTGDVIITGTLRDGLYELDDYYCHLLMGSVACHLSYSSMFVDADREDEQNVPPNHESVLFTTINGAVVLKPKCFCILDVDITDSNSVSQCIPCYLGSTDEFLNGSAPHKLKSTIVGMNPLEILHRESGHLSGGYIKRWLRLSMVKGARYTYEQVKNMEMRVCFDCLKGRMKANPGRPVSSHNWPVFAKIGADYKGPFKIKSYHKYNGFMLLSDHKSHFVTAVMMKSKEGVVDILDDYLHENVEMYDCVWKVLQTDYDKIFLSAEVKQWLKDHHIRLYTSAPHTHDQNGLIERAVQNVMDKARILMGVYDTPQYFWEFAVLCACYLINRSPHASLLTTPLQEATGEIPDISCWVPFYCPGVYHVTKEERMAAGAWAPKAERCRMLGYEPTCKNTYIVYNVRTKRIVSRRDCIFDESLSPQDLSDASIRRLGGHGEEHSSEFTSDMFDLCSDSESDHDDVESEDDQREMEEESNVVEDVGKSVGTDCVDEYCVETPYTEGDSQYSVEDRCWTIHVAMIVHDALALPPNPADIHIAQADPIYGEMWTVAIHGELVNFEDRKTFELAVDQQGRAMKTKFVLTYSYKNDYSIKVKCRLVACGYSQVYGVDYLDTFSPTTTNVVVMILFHIAASRGLFTGVFDVSAAFLEGRADIVNFCRLPKELYKSGEVQERFAVVGNFYGEKQAPKIWYDLYDDIMTTMDFIRCPVMPCLYAKFRGDDYMFVTNHVDDGQMATNNKLMITEFMDHLLTRVKKAEFMEDFKKFLGMDIERDPINNKVKLHHSNYITTKFGIDGKKEKIPMSNLTNLRIQPTNPANESLLSVTGTLRFPADRCRPDILVATGEISCGGADGPSDEHVKVSQRIMNYMSSTPDLGVTLGGSGPIILFGFCDASYVTDGNSKSRLGGCVFSGYDSGAISAFSTNNNNSKVKLSQQYDENAMEVEESPAEIMSTLSHSSCEAEIKGIDLILLLLLHIYQIYLFLKVPVQLPIRVYVDNTSAIELCETLKGNHKIKHINMRINFIREQINAGFIELHFVPTKFNVADILTKPLCYELFAYLRNFLLNGFGGVDPSSLFDATAVFAKANLVEEVK